MKNTLILLVAISTALSATAQKGLTFIETNRLWCPEVQDQAQSGTCWCFSTLSFFESEMKAAGAEDIPNLSEMFVVRYSYLDKAKKYVMMHGKTNFSEGGFFYDNIYAMKNYGLVPESAYPNTLRKGASIYHFGFSDKMKTFIDSVATDDNKIIDPKWFEIFTQKTDNFLGTVPQEFEYKGKTYTPKTFAQEVVKLNPDDYVQITSFTHHPFYEYCILELPDNWRWGQFYNVPLDDMIAAIDSSLAQGHTVVWSSDVSETGFNQSKGYAAMPRHTKVTQESRQADFESRRTTDDHGMQIIGTAKDLDGNKFYIVKNSWGNYNKFGGYLYASEEFVRAKTTGIMINKNVCKFLFQN